ncbi:probable potassium transporter 17 isoform X2 [Tanacetum coccineum]
MDKRKFLLSDSGVQRVPGLCFFYTNIQDGFTPVLAHHIRNMRSIHKVTVFTTLRYLLVPKVAPNEQFVVKRLGQGVYGCLIQYGYADSLDLQGDFVSHINASLQDHIMQYSNENPRAVPLEEQEMIDLGSWIFGHHEEGRSYNGGYKGHFNAMVEFMIRFR